MMRSPLDDPRNVPHSGDRPLTHGLSFFKEIGSCVPGSSVAQRLAVRTHYRASEEE
jgi:hypothetical protein